MLWSPQHTHSCTVAAATSSVTHTSQSPSTPSAPPQGGSRKSDLFTGKTNREHNERPRLRVKVSEVTLGLRHQELMLGQLSFVPTRPSDQRFGLKIHKDKWLSVCVVCVCCVCVCVCVCLLSRPRQIWRIFPCLTSASSLSRYQPM